MASVACAYFAVSEALAVGVDGDRHWDLRRERLQCRREPAFGQCGGVDAARQLAQLCQARLQLGHRLVEQRRHRCGIGFRL